MVNMKFAISMQRFIPYLGYHHVLMFLLCAPLVMLSILLAGCSSYSTMTNVYILGLSYINTTSSNPESGESALATSLSTLRKSAQLEVRAGYFGICVRQHGIVWLCSGEADGLQQQIGVDNDPLNLINAASKFRNDVVFPGLLFMAIVLSFFGAVLLNTFPGWHEERDQNTGSDVDIKPFPSRPVSQVVLSCIGVAAALGLVSAIWQHVGSVGAAAMAEMAYYGNVKADIGTIAMTLAWISMTITTIVAIGLLVMILSIRLLDRITDNN